MKLDAIALTTSSCTNAIVTCRKRFVTTYLPSCDKLDVVHVAQGLADMPLQVQHPLSAFLVPTRWLTRDIS